MSYKEVQFEEKSVQLMQEDIDALSAYSWDMSGYTSRFGFFYQGNENADIDGLTKWQAEHIFQLTPTPPGMEDPLQNIEKSRHISKEKKRYLHLHIPKHKAEVTTILYEDGNYHGFLFAIYAKRQ